MFYIYSGWEGLRSFDNFKVFEIFRYSIPLRTTEFNMFVGFHPTLARVDIQAQPSKPALGKINRDKSTVVAKVRARVGNSLLLPRRRHSESSRHRKK